MKKNVYTIGRDETCDIIICDDSNLASRFHACLKEVKSGKYVITDQSTNGTYINGIRITQGVEVPVTREDSIRFANIVELDWSIIPDNHKKKKRIILVTILCSLLCAGMGWCAYNFYFADKQNENPQPAQQPTDTAKTQKPDTVKVKVVTPKPAHTKKAAPEQKPEKRQENQSKVVNPIF